MSHFDHRRQRRPNQSTNSKRIERGRTDDVYRRAVHEAGHAVLQFVLSIELDYVTVKTEGLIGGQCVILDAQAVDQRTGMRHLCVAWGGYFAQHMLTEVAPSDFDWASYHDACIDHYQGLDYSRRLVAYVEPEWARERLANGLFCNAGSFAEALVREPTLNAAIWALADLLAERETLQGYEVREFLSNRITPTDYEAEFIGYLDRNRIFYEVERELDS